MADTPTNNGQLLVRLLIYCAVLFGAQWFVPYYLLALGALAFGIFTIATSSDKRQGYILLIAALFIAVVGWVSVTYWQGK